MGGNGIKQIVIKNGTLIDGSGRPATANDTIVIEANRIRSVGQVPEDVRLEDKDGVLVIDASGQVIMPGLIDAHCHLSLRAAGPAGSKVAHQRRVLHHLGGPECPEDTEGRGDQHLLPWR